MFHQAVAIISYSRPFAVYCLSFLGVLAVEVGRELCHVQLPPGITLVSWSKEQPDTLIAVNIIGKQAG